MNPISTGCCIGEAQEVAETGRAWQPQRSRRREAESRRAEIMLQEQVTPG